MKMKPNFSAFRIALLVVLTAGVMTSCGKSDLLTVGDVKNAVKEILEPHWEILCACRYSDRIL